MEQSPTHFELISLMELHLLTLEELLRYINKDAHMLLSHNDRMVRDFAIMVCALVSKVSKP